MSGSVSGDTHALRAVPLFASLRDEQLQKMFDGSVPRRHGAGEALRVAGDPATHLVLLLEGQVSATATTPSGRVVRFGTWKAPCALDKVAVIDGGGHTATLTAEVSCRVRSLPRERFLRLVDDASSVRRHVLSVLAERARHQQEQWVATATRSTEARLAAWLLHQAATYGGLAPMPRGQQELADLLGVTRVTVNRALSRLSQDGLIDVRRGEVEVLAPELLELRVGERSDTQPHVIE